MKSWAELTEKHSRIGDRYGDNARLDRDMRQLADAVRNDPEVERILAQRAQDQGMD